MSTTRKTRLTIAALLLSMAGFVPLSAQGPSFDTRGNSRLSGTYYFRHVVYSISNTAEPNDGTYGDIEEGIALYGNIFVRWQWQLQYRQRDCDGFGRRRSGKPVLLASGRRFGL